MVKKYFNVKRSVDRQGGTTRLRNRKPVLFGDLKEDGYDHCRQQEIPAVEGEPISALSGGY